MPELVLIAQASFARLTAAAAGTGSTVGSPNNKLGPVKQRRAAHAEGGRRVGVAANDVARTLITCEIEDSADLRIRDKHWQAGPKGGPWFTKGSDSGGDGTNRIFFAHCDFLGKIV